MSNQDDQNKTDNSWLGITSTTRAGAEFEYVCTLENRQLSGGLVLGAIDRRPPKDRKCGLGACADDNPTGGPKFI